MPRPLQLEQLGTLGLLFSAHPKSLIWTNHPSNNMHPSKLGIHGLSIGFFVLDSIKSRTPPDWRKSAAILGGTSLRGGRGPVLGSLVGACIIEMLSSALILLGLSQPWKEVATGGLILIVSVVDWLGQRWTIRAKSDMVERPKDTGPGLSTDAQCDV